MDWLYVNRSEDLFGPLMSRQEHHDVQKLVSLVGPDRPIRHLALTRATAGAMPSFRAAVTPYSLDHIFRALLDDPSIHGIDEWLAAESRGSTGGRACLGALGEYAERMGAALGSIAARSAAVQGCSEEFARRGIPHLGPDSLWLYAREQYVVDGFQFDPFEPTQVLTWSPMRSASGTEMLVPCQLVHLFYRPIKPEPLIFVATTSGIATGQDESSALSSAILELIERDAFALAWHARIPPIAFSDADVASVVANSSLLKALTPHFSRIRLYLLATDKQIAPCVLAVKRNEGWSQLAVQWGISAGTTIVNSAERAVGELLQSEVPFSLANTHGNWDSLRPFVEDVQSYDNREPAREFTQVMMHYGQDPHLLTFLNWLETSPTYEESWLRPRVGSSSLVDVPYATRKLTPYAACAANGIRILHSRVDGLPDMNAGLPPVVRVISPDLCEVSSPPDTPLGHPRFYDLPRALGLSNNMLTFEDLRTELLPLP